MSLLRWIVPALLVLSASPAIAQTTQPSNPGGQSPVACAYLAKTYPQSTCASVSQTWGLTVAQFQALNPNVTDCTNPLPVGQYCVIASQNPSGTGAQTATTSAANLTATTGPPPPGGVFTGFPSVVTTTATVTVTLNAAYCNPTMPPPGYDAACIAGCQTTQTNATTATTSQQPPVSSKPINNPAPVSSSPTTSTTPQAPVSSKPSNSPAPVSSTIASGTTSPQPPSSSSSLVAQWDQCG
ncbi:hypothetical protein PG984_010582 [Apiospora sp. TS-2023a]